MAEIAGDDARRYDIVIFGASGFTGQFVVEEVARIADQETGLTWAISGRSMQKLSKVLEEAAKQTGKDLEMVPVVIADVNDEGSLLAMAQKAKIVLNCVGPYRFYGEKVVKACIEGGAHHLDISGEPQYIERMQLLYHGSARESKVYCISACGFDSIPAEFGVIHAKEKFKDGEINSIESFLNFSEGVVGNTGTFESAIYGFLHAGELSKLRKSLYPEPLPTPKYKIEKRGAAFKSEAVSKWCVEFMGSDKSVVRRTQRFNYEETKERPIQYNPYICTNGIFHLIGMMIFGIVFGVMTKFSLTRKLMMAFPSFFTFGTFKKGGPSRKEIEGVTFSMTLVSKGWKTKVDGEHDSAPDTVTVTKVNGPEPGYVTTPICLVQAALVLLKEKDKLPKDGGVYPPGAAFQHTSLLKRLQDHNILFSEVSE